MMMRTGLVFVLLLCLCSHSSAQAGCNRKLLENVDFQGENITVVASPDVHHCQQMCTQNAFCRFFTFVRADWTIDNSNYHCILKKSSSGKPDEQKPLVGVTSGYSLKPCRPVSAPCFPQVYVDIAFPGADYRSLFTSDYKACQRACTEDPGCQFFTWHNTVSSFPEARYKCYLKFSWPVPAPPRVDKLDGDISGFSYYAKINTGNYFQACQSEYFPNTEISGSDLLNRPAVSPEHCQILCSAHPLCTYFSFQDTTCYLKSNTSVMVTVAKQGVTSGLPSRFCQQDRSWLCSTYNNTDFFGQDLTLTLLKNNLTSCQKACNDDPNCQYYTFVQREPGTGKSCYLKRVITIPAPPTVNKRANVISGFTLQNCAGQPSGVCSV